MKMELITAIRRFWTISFLPEPFKRMAIVSEEANCKIRRSYNRLRAKVGKQKADELMAQFQSEAFSGREVNHEYMIRNMDNATKK